MLKQNKNKILNSINNKSKSPLVLSQIASPKTDTMFTRNEESENMYDTDIDINFQKLNSLTNNDLHKLMNSRIEIDADTKFLMTYVKELEELTQQLNKDLKNLIEKETNRVSHEFLVNDYQRRFNCSIELVLSAIVGRDNAGEYMKKIYLQKNDFYNNIKLCRNYNNFNDKMNILNDKITNYRGNYNKK